MLYNLLSDYRPHCRRAHGLPIESLATVNRKAMQEMAKMYGLIGETQGDCSRQGFQHGSLRTQTLSSLSEELLFKAMKIAGHNSMTRPTTEIMGMTIVGLGMLSSWVPGLNRNHLNSNVNQ